MNRRILCVLASVLCVTLGLLVACSGTTPDSSDPSGDGDEQPDGDGPEDGDAPEDGDETPDGDTPEDGDETPDGDTLPDGDDIDAGREAFAAAARTNEPFLVLPDSPVTQIHPYAAFDGEAVWVATNIPDRSTGGFDVWGVRIDARGGQLLDPIQLSTTKANCIDPALAVANERLLAVWQCDTGEFPQNLHVIARAFHRDGRPVAEHDTALVVTLEGSQDVVAGNAWMPDVVGLADGSFAVVSAFAAPDASGFQVLLSHFSADGEVLGSSRYVSPSSGSQVYPSIAATPDGLLLVSWNEQTTETEQAAYAIGSIDGGFSEPWIADGVTAGATKVASSLGGLPLLAYTVGDQRSTIQVMDPDSGDDLLNVGLGTVLNHSPQLAWGERAGFMVWVRTVRGPLDAQITLQRVVRLPNGWGTTAQSRVVNTGKAPGYFAPSALAITDDLTLIVWAEGTSPNFVLYGMYASPVGLEVR